jgi:TonB family protein
MSVKALFRLLVAAMLIGTFALLQPAAFGQEVPDAARRVKTQISPTYPDLAKRMNVHGHVKLVVTITPEGKVKSVHLLGGHPLLGSAAQAAVQQWRFEPGPKETTQIIEFNFD